MAAKRRRVAPAKSLAEAEKTFMAIASYGAVVNDEPESRQCARNWLDQHASRKTRAEIAQILAYDASLPPAERTASKRANKAAVSVTLSQDVLLYVDDLASSTGRSRSAVIEQSLRAMREFCETTGPRRKRR